MRSSSTLLTHIPYISYTPNERPIYPPPMLNSLFTRRPPNLKSLIPHNVCIERSGATAMYSNILGERSIWKTKVEAAGRTRFRPRSLDAVPRCATHSGSIQPSDSSNPRIPTSEMHLSRKHGPVSHPYSRFSHNVCPFHVIPFPDFEGLRRIGNAPCLSCPHAQIPDFSYSTHEMKWLI